MARELKRPGVTMTILCEEYREAHPGGYGYSRFCDLLRDFERRLTPVIRQQYDGVYLPAARPEHVGFTKSVNSGRTRKVATVTTRFVAS